MYTTKKLNNFVNLVNNINNINTELQIINLLLNKLINEEIAYINLNLNLSINEINKILEKLK
ncbi:MAG: hypothetical protein QXX36_03300 [Candidatus Rehaiarchaeum fermentans]|nr:hypothetical protein [Candidatus Rehaiarchaeum fermentans]